MSQMNNQNTGGEFVTPEIPGGLRDLTVKLRRDSLSSVTSVQSATSTNSNKRKRNENAMDDSE